MGKPEAAIKKKESRKSPVGIAAVGKPVTHLSMFRDRRSRLTTVLLIFVVIAPLLIEQLKVFPYVWGLIQDALAKVGLVSR